MLVKCATCQRQYESTKFSVDCPHETALTEWARSTGLPRKEWEHDADHAASVATELSSLPNQTLFIDDTVTAEDITEEMIEEWFTARVDATSVRDYTKSYCMKVEKELMAAAVNIYLKHTATSVDLSGSAGSLLDNIDLNALHSISAHLDHSVSDASPPSLRSGD